MLNVWEGNERKPSNNGIALLLHSLLLSATCYEHGEQGLAGMGFPYHHPASASKQAGKLASTPPNPPQNCPTPTLNPGFFAIWA